MAMLKKLTQLDGFPVWVDLSRVVTVRRVSAVNPNGPGDHLKEPIPEHTRIDTNRDSFRVQEHPDEFIKDR